MPKEVSYEELVAHLMAAYQEKGDDEAKKNVDTFIELLNRNAEEQAENGGKQDIITNLKRLCSYAMELRSKAQEATKAYAKGDMDTARKLMRQARRAATDLKVQCSIYSLDKNWPESIRPQCRAMVHFIEEFSFNKGEKYLELQLDNKQKWNRYIKEKLKEAEEDRNKKGPGLRRMTDQQYFALVLAATMREYANAGFDPADLQKNMEAIQKDPVFRYMASDPRMLIDYLRSPSTVVKAWQNMSNIFVETTEEVVKDTVESLNKLGKLVPDDLSAVEQDGWMVYDVKTPAPTPGQPSNEVSLTPEDLDGWVIFEKSVEGVSKNATGDEALEQIKDVTNSAIAYLRYQKGAIKSEDNTYRMDMVIDALAIIAKTSPHAMARVNSVIQKVNKMIVKEKGEKAAIDIGERGLKHAKKLKKELLDITELAPVSGLMHGLKDFLTDQESDYESEDLTNATHELAMTIAMAKASVVKTNIGGQMVDAMESAAIKKRAAMLEKDEAVIAMAGVFSKPGPYRKALLGESEMEAIQNIEKEYDKIKLEMKRTIEQGIAPENPVLTRPTD